MTKENIIVGKYYTRGSYRYLGCGKRKMWTGNISNTADMEDKFLVCITNDDCKGLIVKEGEDVSEGFWDGFILDPNQNP